VAIPTSGGGSEILKTLYKKQMSSTDVTLFTADADRIVTILSIIYTNLSSSDTENINLWVDAGYNDVSGTGSTDIYILHGASLPAKGTFVFSDKFVLYGLDVLKTNIANSGSVDVYVTYIEQDYS
tara:strand:- start:383 stop:757 length:375 start_codon:yes stop_codon:yes gene_type:complete